MHGGMSIRQNDCAVLGASRRRSWPRPSGVRAVTFWSWPHNAMVSLRRFQIAGSLLTLSSTFLLLWRFELRIISRHFFRDEAQYLHRKRIVLLDADLARRGKTSADWNADVPRPQWRSQRIVRPEREVRAVVRHCG